jgi:hypothetical protein
LSGEVVWVVFFWGLFETVHIQGLDAFPKKIELVPTEIFFQLPTKLLDGHAALANVATRARDAKILGIVAASSVQRRTMLHYFSITPNEQTTAVPAKTS